MALVTLKEAVEVLNKAHDIDPEKEGRNAYSIKTIYNAIHARKLRRYGLPHIAKVDSDELLKLLGPKQTG